MSQLCNHCGFEHNDDGAQFCSRCGHILTAAPAGLALRNVLPEVSWQSVSENSYNSGQANVIDVEPLEESHRSCPLAGPGFLEGEIVALERTEERPEVKWAWAAVKIVIGLLCLIPLFSFFAAMGIISMMFFLVGFPSFSRLFNPAVWALSFFEFLEIGALLNLRKGPKLVTIFRGVVQNRGGERFLFQMQGPMRFGNLVPGHTVRLEGSWREGSFVASGGTDLTANAVIRVKSSW